MITFFVGSWYVKMMRLNSFSIPSLPFPAPPSISSPFASKILPLFVLFSEVPSLSGLSLTANSAAQLCDSGLRSRALTLTCASCGAWTLPRTPGLVSQAPGLPGPGPSSSSAGTELSGLSLPSVTQGAEHRSLTGFHSLRVTH